MKMVRTSAGMRSGYERWDKTDLAPCLVLVLKKRLSKVLNSIATIIKAGNTLANETD